MSSVSPEPLYLTLMESVGFSEELDFKKYWLVLRRRWLPGMVASAIVVTLAVLSTSREETIYKAGGKLLLKEDRSAAALTGLEGLDEAGRLKGLTLNSEPLATQAQVVLSRPIAEKTVKELNLQDEEGNPLEPETLLKGLTAEPVAGTDVLEVTYKSDDPELAAAVVNKTMEGYIENNIETNRAQAVAARKFLEGQVPRIQARVSRAEEDLRRFKEENKVVSLVDEAAQTVKTIAQLEQQIATTEAELANVSSQVAEVEQQLDLTPEEAVAASALSQSTVLQNLRIQLREVMGELAVERARYKPGHPTIKNLERTEANLKALIEEQIILVLGDKPAGVTLASGKTQALENLEFSREGHMTVQAYANLEAERLGLASELDVLLKKRATYKEQTKSFPRLEQKLGEMQRKLEIAQSTYQVILGKLQEAQVAENQNVGNARIISPATEPQKPVPSKKKLVIAAGGVMGILLGLAIAFLLDLIDGSVKTVKEAKELFGYTLLGIIPIYGKSRRTRKLLGDAEGNEQRIVVREQPHSPLSAAYQMLQANLKFLSSDKPLKAIVVTSSVPKEGKSDVCANLAAAMAQVGRRVLLVDGDMREPSQHHIWQLTNAVGLSNILVGEAEFNTVVQTVMPGLDVLPCGVIPPNPVGLLDSKRMASLIEAFSNKYDFIIFDAPPLAGVADAPILGKMTDGILLVVRPRVVNSTGAKAAKEFLSQSGQNVLGFVANGVIIRNEPDSYFYYTKEQYGVQASASQEQAVLSVSSGAEDS